jgi:hypothetical protein
MSAAGANSRTRIIKGGNVPRKSKLEIMEEAMSGVFPAPAITVLEEFTASPDLKVEVAVEPFWRVTFIYLEDFQLSGDRRKELVQEYLNGTQPGFAIDRAFKNGLVVVDDKGDFVQIPVSRVLQAKVEKIGG